MKKGIDVSVWQGPIDWAKVKSSGVEFAMLRAGRGKSIDANFCANAEGCKAVGLPFGVYWFSYARNEAEARAEAKACLETIRGLNLLYPVAFDFEYDSVNYAESCGITVTPALATAIAEAFCEEIEEAGYRPMLYTNLDYLSRYFSAELAAKYDLWLAAWSSKANPPRACAIWQHSATGTVPGISGSVDMDRCYEEYPERIEFSDVPADAWYYDAVQWAVSRGITNGTGDGKFSPDEICTRAQIVTFLWRAAGCPEPAYVSQPFTDVKPGAWYADAVHWAVEQGITCGTGGGRFCPNRECTRAEIVTMLWRAAGAQDAEGVVPFNDVPPDAWYYEAAIWAYETGVIRGTGVETFEPYRKCTRAEAVTMLQRADTH